MASGEKCPKAVKVVKAARMVEITRVPLGSLQEKVGATIQNN
jgi:hypothetical protein